MSHGPLIGWRSVIGLGWRGRTVGALAVLTVLAGAPGAWAQTVPGSQSDTILTLSATASVPAVPDRLAATMHGTATGPSAAAASAALNRIMAAARSLAKPFPQLQVEAGAYQVTQHDPPDRQWDASQTLQITARDGSAAALDLVGQLQAHNMVTDGIGWQMSPDAIQAKRIVAIGAALKALRAQADQAAAALGLHVARFRTVTIDDAGDVARPMMAMAVRARVDPSVDQPQTAVISATVHGDAELTP